MRAIALLALIVVGGHASTGPTGPAEAGSAIVSPAEAGHDGSGAADYTPFELAQPGGIAVPVMLNGAGPFMLLLDTGSSHSAISEDLARTLGAPTVARTVVASPLGEDVRTVVRIERLEVGPMIAADVLPSVLRRKAIDETGRIQGLIGQDVLALRRFTIDFQRRRVVWHGDPVEPRGRPAFKLEFEEGRFLVALPQGGSMLRLVPDSGAEGLVLFHTVFQDVPRPLLSPTGRESAELATLTERRIVRQVTLREFRIGPITLRDVPVALVEGQEADRSAGDGLLPLNFFERVTFDGPQRLLILDGRLLRSSV